MSEKILLVDDEPNLLQSIRRTLRGRYEIELAEGGSLAIEKINSGTEYAVLISDMQMPEIDGLKVLAEARRVIPDTVRVMLTGNVDQQTAVDAVNDGAIFRFINKPCPAEKLAAIIDDGLKQYRLVTAERELLSKTLTGSVGVLNEVLSLANPKAFGRSGRVRQLVKRICERLELPDAWQYEIAAMLSQIGAVGFPEEPDPSEVSVRSLPELPKLMRCAEAGAGMVSKIPRLQKVADIIQHQYSVHQFDLPHDVQLGSKLLRMAIEFDVLRESRTPEQAVRYLEAHSDQFDAAALKSLSDIVFGDRDIRTVGVLELVEGMILEKDVYTTSGDKLISSGYELTATLIQRLKAFVRGSTGVREPIVVRCDRSPQLVHS